MKRYSSGYSLIETLLAVFVTISTVSVIAAGYRSMAMANRGSAEGQTLLVLIERIQKVFGDVGSYATLTPTVAITAQAVPPALVFDATTLRADAGVLTLAPATLSVANDGFQMTLPLRNEACTDTLTLLEPRAMSMSGTDAGGVTRTVNRIAGYSNIPGFVVAGDRAQITPVVTTAWIRNVCGRTTRADVSVTMAFL